MALASVGLVLAGASAVAGRFGVSDHAVASLGIGLAVMMAVSIALLSRSMRVPVYRSVHAGLASAAHAALVLVAVLGAVLAWPDAMAEGALPAILAALALHAGWSASVLLKSGSAVFADALNGRWSSRLLGSVVAFALAGAIAVLALMVAQAALASLSSGFGLPAPTARWLVLGAVAVVLLPGGMAGLAGVAGLAIVLGGAGWLSPLMALTGPDIMLDSASQSRLIAHLGGKEVSPLTLAGWSLAAAGMLVALDTAQPAGSPRLARRVLLAGLVAAPLMVAVMWFGSALVERRTDALFTTPVAQWPSTILSDRAQEQVVFCDRPYADVKTLERACERLRQDGRLPAGAITIQNPGHGRWMATVLDLPAVTGVLRDLAAPSMLILFAAWLLHGAGGLLVHDGFYRLLGRQGTASGRLALHRAVSLGLAWVALQPAGVWPLGDGPRVVTTALALLAALPLPLLLLGLWPRVDWKAALCGVTAAGGVVAALWSGHVAPELSVIAAPVATLGAGTLAALIFPAGQSSTDAKPAVHAGDAG